MNEAPTAIHIDSVVPEFTVPDVVKTASTIGTPLAFDSPLIGQRRQRLRSCGAMVWNCSSTARTDRRCVRAFFAISELFGVLALAEELRTRGADIVEGPVHRVYDSRELIVRDCDGLVLESGEDTSAYAT